MKLLPLLILAVLLAACQSSAEPGYVVSVNHISSVRCEVVYHGIHSGRTYPMLNAYGELCDDLYVGMPVDIAAGGKSITGTTFQVITP